MWGGPEPFTARGADYNRRFPLQPLNLKGGAPGMHNIILALPKPTDGADPLELQVSFFKKYLGIKAPAASSGKR